ncbi:Synerg-CTERM sorting domain-containing protein [Cloacibacillus porcorum]
MILGAEKKASGGSSSGCSAGLGALALLSLAALPLVYRRKK